MTTRYTCSTRGICEAEARGRHATLAECQQKCTSAHQRDVLLLIYRNNLGDAALLAPSDREEILWGLVGIRFPPSETKDILLGLENISVSSLLHYPALVEYASRIWTPAVLRDALLHSNDSRAFDYLPTTLSRLTVKQREQFARLALTTGNIEAISTLYDEGYHVIISGLLDIILDPATDLAVLTVLFENDGELFSQYIPGAIRRNAVSFIEAALDTGYITTDEVADMQEEYEAGEWY